MRRTPEFAAIPNIPQAGIVDWQYYVLNSLKENVEQLAGTRGGDPSNQAVTRGSITVNPVPAQSMQRVTASGFGFSVEGVSVPSLEDYLALLTNVQQLANDVAQIRQVLNTLIQQMKV
jgi:hypothetical protein